MQAGLAMILVIGLSAIFASSIAPYDPLKQNLAEGLRGPSWSHLLGQDELGRDVLSRILFGARASLEVGAAVTGSALAVGIILGMLAGYYGSKTDMVIMRLVDIFLSFPGIILAIGVVAVIGASLEHLMFALMLLGWPPFARLMRGEVLKVKELAFVTASKGMGGSSLWIMRKHVLPSAIPPVIVLASIGFGWAVLGLAGLSFLGLGIHPPTPDWGGMIAEGLSFILEAPYISLFGGLAIAITVLSFNMLGDGLRDALDSTQRG